jgi:hypothetical protein
MPSVNDLARFRVTTFHLQEVLMHRISVFLVALAGFTLPAAAQDAAGAGPEPLIACQSQQALQQVIGSQGSIMPDGCRNVSISVLQSNGERLCLVDLSEGGEGVLDQLRDVAVNQEWWIRCDDLAAAAR